MNLNNKNKEYSYHKQNVDMQINKKGEQVCAPYQKPVMMIPKCLPDVCVCVFGAVETEMNN